MICYTGYGTRDSIRVLGRVVLVPKRARSELGKATEELIKRRGFRNFVSAACVRATVTISVGDEVVTTTTDRGGYIDQRVRNHGLQPGWRTVEVRSTTSRTAHADVHVIADDIEFGLVSDIDDTIISTMLPRPMIAAWNSFIRDESARQSVPGMARMYADLLADHPGSPVIYISTGAWNTHGFLSRFLKRHGYPAGPMLLTDWGPTNTGWFRSGMAHKTETLLQLTRDLPNISWLLVGDDGQHDPVIYADFAHVAPGAGAGDRDPPADAGRAGTRARHHDGAAGGAGQPQQTPRGSSPPTDAGCCPGCAPARHPSDERKKHDLMVAKPPLDEEATELIVDVDVSAEMETSFLEYAYSVIYSRALPDARDGLKPVQRRILYTMDQMRIRPDTSHVKCSRVVGQVMGLYHPHGDTAIYDALVRQAQPWAMRLPTVDGHGNFGSLDSGPAAMRYTECRMSPAAVAMTADIASDTVDFRPNYDGKETEPVVLPVGVPQPAGQRQHRDRRRHGHQHPAAQPRRGRPGAQAPDVAPGRRRRRPDAVRPGPRLPRGRQDHRP